MVHYYCSNCGVANGAVTFHEFALGPNTREEVSVCDECEGLETIKLGVPVEPYENTSGE